MAMTWRRGLLPAMLAILAVYVAVHSPAVGVIGRAVGHRAATCYFVCSGWAPNGRPLDAIAAIVCLLLAGWAGRLLVSRLDCERAERLLAFGLVTLALIVAPAAWLGLVAWAAGLPALRPPLGPLLTAVPAAAVLLAGYRRGWRCEPWSLSPVRAPRLVAIVGGIAATLLALSLAVSFAHPPTGYDALSYHAPLAVYYWRDGDLGSYLDRQPWAWALAHPGTAELWFGLLRVAAGEGIANLGQWPFALLGAIAVYLLARRTGLTGGPAALSGVAFLAAPIVVVQSGVQLNDLAAGALVLAAIAIAAAPPAQWTPARVGLLGLALGLTITTKLAALPAAIGVLIYVALKVRAAPRRGALLAAGSALFVLVVGPWWLRNTVMFGNPIFPAALPILGRGYVVGDFVRKDGWFVPATWAWPLYPVLEPHDEMSGFGALFAVVALPGLLAALAWARRGPLLLIGIVALVSGLAWWKLTQHEPRLLLGVVGTGFIGVGWALVALPRGQRRVAGTVIVATALFSAAVTVDRAVLPHAALPNGRALFYETEWGVDSTVAALPPEDGLMYHTGYAYRSYAGDYPLLGPRQGRALTVIDGILPGDSIARLMRARGLRYAYVPTAAASEDSVRAMYPAGLFDLVHSSTRTGGQWKETRRLLFRLRESARP